MPSGLEAPGVSSTSLRKPPASPGTLPYPAPATVSESARWDGEAKVHAPA